MLRLLATPAQCMDAWIDDKSSRPPHLEGEHPRELVGSLVHSHLHTETFAVESPPFAERGDVDPAELGQIELLGEGEVEAVPGGGLVQRERRKGIQGTSREIVRIQDVCVRSSPPE